MNPINYKILEYIHNQDKVSLQQLLDTFPDSRYSIKRRLHNFCHQNPPLVEAEKEPLFNDFGEDIGSPTGYYLLSEYGKIDLQDYLENKQSYQKALRRDILFKVFPIIISTIALLKSFEKEIIWLSQRLMQVLK